MLPSVDSLLACLFMTEPPRGYSTAMPVSTLLWMLLPALPDFLHADASVGNTGEGLNIGSRLAMRHFMHTD